MTTRLEARGSTPGTGESTSVVQLSRCSVTRQWSRAARVKIRLWQAVLSTPAGETKLIEAGKFARAAAQASGRVRLSDGGLHPPALAPFDVESAIEGPQLLPGTGGVEAVARKGPGMDPCVISGPKCQPGAQAPVTLPRKRVASCRRLAARHSTTWWPTTDRSCRPPTERCRKTRIDGFVLAVASSKQADRDAGAVAVLNRTAENYDCHCPN